MYRYKRGIDDIAAAKNLQFVLTDGKNTSLSLSALLEAKKIYNGMYIKNGKILVENLVEKIELKNATHKIGSFSTKSTKLSTEEYVTGIDLENNLFEYEMDGFKYTKRICFDTEMSDLLVVEYKITNTSKNKAKFSAIPLVTYRSLMDVKTYGMLNFNHRDKQRDVFINLSVSNNSNVYLCSDKMEFVAEKNYLKNVKHEYISKDLTKKIFEEDLYIPGNFEISLKSGEEKIVYICISSSEIELQNEMFEEIFEKYEEDSSSITSNIEDEYVELKDMAVAMKNTYLGTALGSTVPYISFETTDYTNELFIQSLIELVKAIEGRYLDLGQADKARRLILLVKDYICKIDISSIENENNLKNIVLLRLWLAESMNRFLSKENVKDDFTSFFKESVYLVSSHENVKKIVYNNIELISLYYNLLKIYDSCTNNIKQEDSTSYNLQEEILKLITDEFWIEDKRILKENLDDEKHIAKISMIYSLALSYPLVTGKMGIKLLDTIFKELYTPYGLREYSKFSSESDSLIYPKYMAYFVKANLRQNGVTRASQKLAYNLVKELMLDISKYVNGGVRKIYSDKGILVDSLGYDILTNAELVRLYKMLT